MAPPQYSQRPLASGIVVAPQKGQVTAVLGALAADAIARLLAQLHQRVADFGCLALGLAVLNGSALLDGGVVHAQADLGKVRRVDVDGQVKVVIQVVARRIIALALAVLGLAIDLGAMLVDVHVAAEYLRELDDVGVGVAPAALRGNDQLARVLVEHDVGASGRKRARGVERRQAFGIGLAVGELLADVVCGAGAPAAKEGGELAGALFAQVAFVDLGFSQKTQLGTANRALFLLEHLVKEAHGCLPSTGSVCHF